jgi:hypothetical protein
MNKPRTLSDAERDVFWERAASEWDIRTQYWYPLEPTSRADVVAFNASAFHAAVGAEGVRAALGAHGVSRVIETHELAELPTREIDVAHADFVYEFAEGYWCDGQHDWIVYVSHEDSLTIGGRWLIDAITQQWPEWDRHVWTRW